MQPLCILSAELNATRQIATRQSVCTHTFQLIPTFRGLPTSIFETICNIFGVFVCRFLKNSVFARFFHLVKKESENVNGMSFVRAERMREMFIVVCLMRKSSPSTHSATFPHRLRQQMQLVIAPECWHSICPSPLVFSDLTPIGLERLRCAAFGACFNGCSHKKSRYFSTVLALCFAHIHLAIIGGSEDRQFDLIWLYFPECEWAFLYAKMK
jgi:hypothetical protein